MEVKKYSYPVYMLLAVYLAIACYKLDSPGLQYDELLFVNAALHDRSDNSFVCMSLGNFPVLLMAYIGALKSYIYYPLVNVLGVSVWTLRLPVLCITMISLFTIYNIVNRMFFRNFALMVLTILVLDPTFIYMTRLDVGPNVLELFTKCMACLFFCRYFYEKADFKYLLYGIIFLGLGFFNKLNFLWFINALYATIFIIQFNVIKKAVVHREAAILKPYLVIAVTYVLFVLYFILVALLFDLGDEQGSTIASKIPNKFYQIRDVLNGKSFLKYIYGIANNGINTAMLVFYFLIISVGAILNICVTQNEFILKYRKIYTTIILIIVFDIIQMLLTKQANAPWHAFTLYPFFTVLLVYSIYCIYSVLYQHKRLATATAAAFISVILVYQTAVITDYIKALGTPVKNIAWSEKVYELIEYTKAGDQVFISLDWGIHNALISFDNKKDKYYEGFHFFNTEHSYEEKKAYREKYLNKESSVIIIAHASEEQIFKHAFQNFEKFADEFDLKIVPLKMIQDEKRVIFILYKIEPQLKEANN